MAARLTDRQKKKIIADYVELGSFNAVSKIHGVSRQTIKNVVDADPTVRQHLQRKKEENTADILAYMDKHKDLVCTFIGKGLELLNDPKKLVAANLTQITTAMGTVIDKWAMIGGASGDTVKDDALSQSLRQMAEELESDDQS